MKRIYKIILITIILSIISSCARIDENTVKDTQVDTNVQNEGNVRVEQSKRLNCLYYNELDFKNIKQFEIKDVGTIRGCIVPHHLLASMLIHEIFQSAANNAYDTVVILGPDHESADMGKVFTTKADYGTPFGGLKTNKDIVTSLTDLDFVKLNDEKMTIEHSTSGLVPFVKYYMPNANVVTLAITKQTKLSNIDKLADTLIKNTDDKTLFIASIDFSHYLTMDKANKKDEISNEAIINKDEATILSFTNDNLDSPISVVTMLKLMDKLNVENVLNVNHSNSQLILKREVLETTSYLTYVFY